MMPFALTLTARSVESAGVIGATACFTALNWTWAWALSSSHCQPVSWLPDCWLNVSGGLHVGTPPSVVVLGELAPEGLPHDTNAWTKFPWNLPAFFGCWKVHWAIAALAEMPTTRTA